MENSKIDIQKALKYLKAGYSLYSFNSKNIKEEYRLKDNIIFISSENKSLKINEYDFLSLYKDTSFYVFEDSNDEIVDIKKDEEYYSWRQ